MATHSSVLAWRIPGTGVPGGLPSQGLQSRTRLKRLSSSGPAINSKDFNQSKPESYKKEKNNIDQSKYLKER